MNFNSYSFVKFYNKLAFSFALKVLIDIRRFKIYSFNFETLNKRKDVIKNTGAVNSIGYRFRFIIKIKVTNVFRAEFKYIGLGYSRVLD